LGERRILTGITWNHTRGYLPLVATAQRFTDANPEVAVAWQVRSLQEFADFPIERLAQRFDLIVIDHPFAGYAAQHPVLLPLDEQLPEAFLADQRAHSVGASYRSYEYGGHQWALPIDAATPVASWRPDILARADAEPPRTWDELLALARRGLVALPAIPVDAMMATYMLCLALGDEPCATPERMVSEETGVAALETLRELVALCDPACLSRNPIRTYEAMTTGDTIGYCPFAYGYANYARADYTDHPLRFGGLVELNGRRLRSTLGGTGLAISRNCKDRALALEYARFVASPEVQRGMYVIAGGQPGHRVAWTDPEVNRLTGVFFAETLPTLDEAWLRPRYSGYIPFQDRAGEIVHRFLKEGGNSGATLAAIDRAYRESLQHA
jgi:multiple sugar transport system substrate-binding protein